MFVSIDGYGYSCWTQTDGVSVDGTLRDEIVYLPLMARRGWYGVESDPKPILFYHSLVFENNVRR